MSGAVLEIPAPQDPTGPIVPDAPTQPAVPDPGPRGAGHCPTGPRRRSPTTRCPPDPDGPSVPPPDEG